MAINKDQDQEGRVIITTQDEFFKRCVDENNNIDAKHVRLKFELDLSRKNFDKDLGEVNFEGAVFENSVVFTGSTFSGDAHFRRATFSRDADFPGSTFSGDADFLGVTFSEKAHFLGARFSDRAFFPRVTFSGYTDFRRVTFSGDADFLGVTFSGDTDFFGATFSEGAVFAVFTRAMFLGNVDFSKTKFFNNVDLFIETQFLKKAKFYRCRFSQTTYFKLVQFSEITFFSEANFNGKFTDFTGTVFKEYGLFHGIKINNATRETHRLIKNEFLKINNRIEALEFHKREMKAYWMELFGYKKIKLPGVILKISRKISEKKIPEKGILIFNRLSTNYGTNWLQGAGFTLVTAFIFYSAFLLLSNCPDWSLEAYFRFLNPAHSYDFLQNFNPNDWAYLIDMIGRVLIGYGYYQTIQAFRKYKRI